MLTLSLSLKAETVIINGEDDWAPYSAKSAQDGVVEGLSVTLVKVIFNAVGVEAEIRQVPYTKCLDDLKRPTQVVGCFNTGRNATNEDLFAWPKDPLFRAKVFIWARKNEHHTKLTIKDLFGKKVGMTNGYEYGSDFDGTPSIDKVVSDTDLMLFRNLSFGRVDYGVAYEFPGKVALKKLAALQEKEDVKPVTILSEMSLYVSFSKHHPQTRHFLELYDAGMEKIKKDGTYQKIIKEFEEKNK